jgi:septal ring factor EnvC (AmiA/AmiB activator)
MRKAACLLWIVISSLTISHAAWPKDTDSAARQSQAEREQSALRERIKLLQQEIDAHESARKEAADALKVSETAISVSSRRIAELNAQQKQARSELESLQTQIRQQQGVMQVRREELAAQLRRQYMSGLSPWTALLSGDDPQQLGRNLAYLDFVSRARAQAVTALNTEIDRLAELQGRADARQQEIALVVRETTEQHRVLEVQKKERATILAQLEGQIQAQRAEAVRLGRDDQHLTDLIGELGTQIEAARYAAEAARQAEQARREEQAKQAAQARAAEVARRAQQAREAEQAARKAADVAKQAEVAQREQAQAASLEAEKQALQAQQVAAEAARTAKAEDARSRDAQAASSAVVTPAAGAGLKPGLRWPVHGAVMARFGTDRPEGGVWRGILVRADEGSPVAVVAGGTVVYANWLRGFGNLVIVDHGQEFLSVYAYNQSVLKQVGDTVKAGDTISLAGNTGGQLDSALYFEIRHRGAAVDPLPFLAK